MARRKLSFILCGACFFGAVSAPCGPLPATTPTSALRDGSHDFDWEFGEWTSKLRRKPAGTDRWLDYTGTTSVRPIWNGQANMVELTVRSPDGQVFKALNLRLYSPQAHQWSTNYANAAVGTMTAPSIGEFRNGVGEFYDQEMIGGKYVLVRFVISRITPTSAHFEQAISADGGRTWELNWIVDDRRVGPAPKRFVKPGS
jgi:hypothetical protein